MRTSAGPIPFTLALVLAALPAAAAPFDPATGTVSLDGAAFSYGFDALPTGASDVAVAFFGPNGGSIKSSTIAFGGQERAIEGHGSVEVGGTIATMRIDFVRPEQLRSRRVDVRLWHRARGTRIAASLRWEAPGLRTRQLVGQATLLPTGAVTDDGWVELSTGPVDFYLGSRIAPHVLIQDEQYLLLFFFDGSLSITPDASARADVDALQVLDLGPSQVSDAPCKTVTEDSACGVSGLCHYGHCADAVAIGGAVPSGSIRDDYLNRRAFEIATFSGIRAIAAAMPDVKSRFQALKTAPTKRFWSGLRAAWNLTRDPHSNPPTQAALSDPGYLGLCTHLGEADALPPDASGKALKVPLVFAREASVPAFAALQPGDALVSIDGMSVDAWKKSASRLLWTVGDPRAEGAFAAPNLPRAAARGGSMLTFKRCPAGIAATRACTASEVQVFNVDMGVAFGGELWGGFTVSWKPDTLGCDWRFQRLPSNDFVSDYTHAVAGDDGDVRVLEFNGVPDTAGPAVANWVATVDSALTAPADKVLLDERYGAGGWFTGIDEIARPLLQSGLDLTDDLFPRVEQTLDGAGAQRFIDCAMQNPGGDPCGDFLSDELGATNRGVLKDSRLAIVVTLDVSGNDYLTRYLTYRTGPTRIFGPVPTLGGFGAIVGLPPHLGEFPAGTFQIHDTDFRTGPLPGSPVFESMTGVSPDEVVFQKQSDLVQNRDTLLEAAKAWLRQ